MQKLQGVTVRQGEIQDGGIRMELLNLKQGFVRVRRFGNQLAVCH